MHKMAHNRRMALTPLKSRLFAVAQNMGVAWKMSDPVDEVAARIKAKNPRALSVFLHKFGYTVDDIVAESPVADAAKAALGDGSDLPPAEV